MMKLLSLLLGLIMLFSLAGSVSAYGIYGQQSSSYYGGYPFSYQESTDFYKNLNSNSNVYTSADSFLNKNTGSQNYNLNNVFQRMGGSGYSTNNLQNLLQNTNMNLNNGYSFTKGPCTTETITGDFRVNSNDFTLRREVCDNIEGTFFRDDRYNNALSNRASQNDLSYGSDAYQNQYSNQNAYNNAFTNQQSSTRSQQQQDFTFSFGKGTRIALN